MFKAGMLHEMYNEPDYGSVECRPLLDLCMSKVKVYHELIDYPSVGIRRCVRHNAYVCIQAKQLQSLLQHWSDMSRELRVGCLGGVRIELTV